MKNVLIFIAGMVTGAVLLLGISFFVAKASYDDGVTLFEKDGEIISENSFQVFQVVESGNALAYEVEPGYLDMLPTDLVVLFLSEDGKSFYDDQIIKVPAGKCVRQIGVYRYPTKDEIVKTVPIVAIRDK